MITVLIVDDDKHIRRLISIHLKEEGFHVVEAENGKDALEKMSETVCDIAVIDIMMPVMDGFELTKELREWYDIPLILLTAKDQFLDKEKGFLLGTDDYMVKPFEPRELVYRMKALLRRYDRNAEHLITIGSTVINSKTYEVNSGKHSFMLPLKEFELLYLLASHPEQVFSRAQIIERIWGFDYEGDERTVDVHIKRLRERFSTITDDFYIKTVRNVGYTIEEKE
ncbi:MAG TPA: response regulator transcription factor [Pseudogracilibacillus sp.]|nr:response regulator transcription factor [Pseudogracilibacillus sp.]